VLYNTSGLSFTYSTSVSPLISSISPSFGQIGLLTINGSSFGSSLGILDLRIF
jgi:hypothetical protein